MIDDKEIDIAARAQALSKHLNETAYFQLRSIEDFTDGAKWAINELLKDLFHPASEVPRNDNGKVLAFSKEFGYRKLYDMNDELDETTCDTYQEMWEIRVRAYTFTDWVFVEDLLDLIKKGGKQ
mgnify:FL=1|jgi:hypothetical protein